MPWLQRTVNVLCTICLLAGIVQPVTIPLSSTGASANSRPLYAIAHRVITRAGVTDAVSHGANAVEIDMFAWRDGWWADHDGTEESKGDSARDMFEEVARKRKEGAPITFVWLDIKNPDWCDLDDPVWKHCSVAGLQDLAREVLEPADVRVLYGFLEAGGKAFEFLRGSMDENEAFNLDGDPKDTIKDFEAEPAVALAKRVASYGSNDLPLGFGDCSEDSRYTCTELRQATQSRNFGKVFGWTSSFGQAEYVDKLLDLANVDGLIYGFRDTYYHDDPGTRAAARDITDWIENHADRSHLATRDELPW